MELDRLASPSGVRAFSVHPGSILTGIARHLSAEQISAFGAYDERGTARIDPLNDLSAIEQGAATALWCATSPMLDGLGGVSCEDCAVASAREASDERKDGVREWAADPILAERLLGAQRRHERTSRRLVTPARRRTPYERMITRSPTAAYTCLMSNVSDAADRRPCPSIRPARRALRWRAIVALAVLATAGATALAADVGDAAAYHMQVQAAMDRMMAGMDAPASGDVDRDFVTMMEPHHRGAIDMAVAELRYGRNEQLRRIAQEIIIDQQQEIAAMRLAVGSPLPPSAPAPTNIPPEAAPPHHQHQHHGAPSQ